MTPKDLGLPETHQGREEAILQAITEDGRHDPIQWVKIVSSDAKHYLELMVMEDALKIKGVRLNVTAATAQHLADYLGACLPTAKILDLVWAQREVTVGPHTQPINSTTIGMIKHSQAIDKDLAGNPEGRVISTLGKHWVIDRDIRDKQRLPNQAINYGWHWTNLHKGSPTASLLKDPETGMYVRMIQSRGWHHDIGHTDYSQICRLVARDCVLDSNPADLADILRDPELFHLVLTNSKPLEDHRHPFVPQRYMGMTIFGK